MKDCGPLDLNFSYFLVKFLFIMVRIRGKGFVNTQSISPLFWKFGNTDLSLKVKVLVTQLYLILCDPMTVGHEAPLPQVLQARILEWVTISFSRGLPNPRIEHRSPTLWADSLPSEPPGKATSDLNEM